MMGASVVPSEPSIPADADPRDLERLLAREADFVIAGLAARWTAWRVELGFEREAST